MSLMPAEWQWVFNESVASTITAREKQTIFDDSITTIDPPSDILCRWISLSNNSTSCTDPKKTILRVMCLLSRCVENSFILCKEGIVLTLSNIVLLLGLSIYLDCNWVEDCPRGYDHWTRILRCSYNRMMYMEQCFLRLLQYRLLVSENEMRLLEKKINETYSSHLSLTRQPVLRDCNEFVPIDIASEEDNENEDDGLLCTEMSVD